MNSTHFDETSVEPIWTSIDQDGSSHTRSDIAQEREHIASFSDHTKAKAGTGGEDKTQDDPQGAMGSREACS